MGSELRRLAVLGSPIAHSKSPALHRAAYRRLGLDWEYTAIELQGHELADFIDGLDASWRGLSLTMPLKHDVLPLLDDLDEIATATGAANTVFFDDGRRRGFNTDVGGIVRTLREAGVGGVHRGVIVGGGATAGSALVAMSQLGAANVRVLVRRGGAAAELEALGTRLGIAVEEGGLDELGRIDDAELVVSTVPGGIDLGVEPRAALVQRAHLLDVAYDPWPSPLGSSWIAAGGTVVHGLGMLLHQALLQVRIFVTGDPTTELPDESAVLAVMRDSL
ncbi:shikimate dehydrogenase [Agromyces sp. NPDC049794]|uniref:shikimate dehydrogenase n=1 Tax=unclassified Agromyces TaxID=2639701 RepID=UPI0033C4528A